MKINQRGRAKFKPAPNIELDEIKRLLSEKIEDEKSINQFEYDLVDGLSYNNEKFNLFYIFCVA